MIISRLKHRVNGYVIMVYLAVSDILVSSLYPLSLVTEYLKYSSEVGIEKWRTICTVKTFLTTLAMTYSAISYITSSFDR